MSSILRPPTITNSTDAYFGFSVTANNFNHINVYFKNITDNIVLFNDSISSSVEFDYSVSNGYPPLLNNKQYSISFQPFNNIGNGGNYITYSWTVSG